MRDQRLQPASEELVKRFAEKKGLPIEKARGALERLRVQQIEKAKEDPFNHGYEPPIWFVVRALLRGYTPSPQEVAVVKRETGLTWEVFAERMRRRLGFTHPVAEVLIMGANRSGKTDFAAKYIMRECNNGGKAVNIGFQTLPTGKQVQMPRVWHYMPNAWKAKNVAGKKSDDINEHISYTKQNGFSNSKITFGNGSDIRFLSYKADVDSSMEGSALDDCWLDEEFPKAYLDAARFRLTSKRGTLICTFTPVNGYTPVVADFLADIRVTREHVAWMLPKDGKAPMPWNELGLTEDEYKRLVAWRNEGKGGDITVPESRPENCFEWIFDERSCDGLDEIPDGRAFARTPRVGVCRGGEAAAIWFYGRDNPYGMPGEVITAAASNQNAIKQILCRVYGVAERIKGRMFPEFKREKHVISQSEVPRDLIRVMVVDPAPERNWVAAWAGYHPPTDILYLYREWPSAYDIPGVGVPEAWAVPSDKKNGINDGERGGGQEPFGFAYLNYKFEWARLEGWYNYKKWLKSGHRPNERCEDWEELENWSEADGVDEKIELRVIDARAGAQSKISMTGNATLFEDVSRLAEGFQPASGQKIEVGVNLIRDRLAKGRVKFVEDCPNMIFAMETYSGADGQKGACKDFIDMLRYIVLSGVTDYTADDLKILERRKQNSQMIMDPRSSERIKQSYQKRRVWW